MSPDSPLAMRRAAMAKGAPSRGKANCAAGSGQQLDFEFLLQHLDLTAERRLRHVEMLGGAAKMQLLTHSDKAAKLF
jgi:hypothetical protein